MADNEYVSAGDVGINKLMIQNTDKSLSFDVSAAYQLLVIKESIFDNCMRGYIVVVDGQGAFQKLPIVGEETLSVSFQTNAQTAPFEMDFRIYKMTDFEYKTKNEAMYKLHFTSSEFINNEKVKIHRSYKNQSVSDIVRDCFAFAEGEDSVLEVDDTTGIHNIIVANKKPYVAINMLTTYAVSPNHKGSYYLFYQNHRGHYFKDVETLFEQPARQTYNMNLINLSETSDDLFSVVKWSGDIMFDMLTGITGGMYANQVIGVDMLSKTYKVEKFDYSDQFGELSHVQQDGAARVNTSAFEDGDESQIRKLVASRSGRRQSSYFKANNGENSTFGKSYEEHLPARLSLMRQLANIKVDVALHGNTEVAAGDIFDCDIPLLGPNTAAGTPERMEHYTGRFLISTVVHTLKGRRHSMVLSMNKDCFSKLPEPGKKT